MWPAPSILPPSCLLSDRWRRKAFSVDHHEYVWLDVFLAAVLRGEWQAFERRLVDGLARFTAASADSRGWPDDRQIEAAANAFRYERNLISSDDTLAWLDRAGLPFDAWTHYLVRRLLHDQQRHPPHDPRPPSFASTSVSEPDFAAEGICSGVFDRFRRTLAGRAATVRLPDCVPEGDLTARVAHLERVESAFRDRARAATTTDALTTQLERHRLEWTRVDLERLSFATADAAREAACCIREDGLTLGDVAIESRQPIRDTRQLLEQLDPPLRDRVLGAGHDELVGPVAVGSRHEIAWVVATRPADLDDPIVRARAELAVVDQLVAHSILTRVRWAEVVRP